MAAFRFLALITVGFILVVLVFLLHAGHARLEEEGSRVLTGPEITPVAGESVVWTLDFGGQRVEEAWPGVQRQPRLYVGAAPGALPTIEARATYLGDEETPIGDAFVAGGTVTGAAGDANEVAFGPLWMSWEHPLQITFTVVDAGGAAAGSTLTPVLRGEVSKDYVAARSVARTLWIVFSIIGALGFAALLATQGAHARSDS